MFGPITIQFNLKGHIIDENNNEMMGCTIFFAHPKDKEIFRDFLIAAYLPSSFQTRALYHYPKVGIAIDCGENYELFFSKRLSSYKIKEKNAHGYPIIDLGEIVIIKKRQ